MTAIARRDSSRFPDRHLDRCITAFELSLHARFRGQGLTIADDGFATAFLERHKFLCKATRTFMLPVLAASALHEEEPKLRICGRSLEKSHDLHLSSIFSSTATILKQLFGRTRVIRPAHEHCSGMYSGTGVISLRIYERRAKARGCESTALRSIIALSPHFQVSAGDGSQTQRFST